MTDEWDPFENEILEWLLSGPRKVPRDVVDTAVTTALLLVHPTRRIRGAIRRAISRQHFALDLSLLKKIIGSAPRTIRLRALSSAAVREGPPDLFASLFRSTIKGRLNASERLLISCALEGRLNFWPTEAGAYARDVRQLLHDRSLDVALHAIPSASKLQTPAPQDIKVLARLLEPAKTRLSALSALNSILTRGVYPSTDLGPQFWRKIERHAPDKDEWVREGVNRLLSLQPSTTGQSSKLSRPRRRRQACRRHPTSVSGSVHRQGTVPW